MFISKDAKELRDISDGVYTNEHELAVYKKVHCAVRDPSFLRRMLGYTEVTECVATLKIPAQSTIVIPNEYKQSRFSKKFRTDQAITQEITPIYAGYKDRVVAKAWSDHDPYYTYKKGKTQVPEYKFDSNKYEICTSGIHFYTTQVEAEAHRW